MTTDPAKRTDRTARKATAEQVMELSRNLPLTRSVPGRAVENATPGQLGFLAALFTAENASRAESKRNRLPGQAGFPQSKELDGYDRGHGRVSRRLGTRTARLPRVHRPSRGPRALRGRGMRQDPPRHRHRHPRLQVGHTGQVLHRLRPDHAAAQGQNREQARPGTQDHRQGRPARHRRARIPAHRHRRRQAPVPGSSPTATKGEASSSPRTSSSAGGATCSATATWPPRSSTASSTTAASSDSTANPTETPTHS